MVLVFDNRDDNVAGAPTIVGMKLSAVQIDIIQEQIDLLIATNDRSPAALRTLVYMQQLLATETRPEKTQLFANYPNPFNPETWIPYELATDTHVQDHDIQHTRCCDPDVAVWSSICWLLHGSGSSGVLGWSECAWRTGCEWFVFLSARNRRNVVDAEDGYFEIVSNDHRIAGMLMFISFPVIADEWVELGSLASSLRNDAFGDQRF